MAAPAADGCLQSCPNCGALVDVREQEPLAKIHCPLCGTGMRVSRQYNHFSIVETLGTGGMGAVYKALDRNLNRMVALKLLRRELSADENYILKLEDEARITASINHPYVVKVFSFGSDRGQYYIAMELVDKGSLDDLMQLQQKVSELQVLSVGLQVASGLQAAHERGLIHRDVKPGNILFADAHTAKITDFGLALLAEHEAEGRGEIWGTPYYIAPEKLNNEPEDFRSDIYSLGGTLFHAVAGRPPFEAESASLVALKHLKSRAVSLQAFAPDVSSETAYVINRMLHKDPNQRYASYTELIDHLKYASDTVTANTNKPRAPKERVVVESEDGGNLAGLLVLILLVLLVIGGVLAFVFRDRLFNDGAKPAGPAVAHVEEGAGSVEAYAEARRQIIGGQISGAQETLNTLVQRTDLPQPNASWIRLHLGLVQMLNHQMSEARETFATLLRAGPFSTKPADKKLATFFSEMAGQMVSREPVPRDVKNVCSKDTAMAFGLLLAGIKNWELGQFESANSILTEFLAGKPDAAARWVTEYAPLARQYTHDYAIYAPLRARQDAGTEKAGTLRKDFAQARAQLQTTGSLPEVFYLAESDLKSERRPAQSSPAPTTAAAVPASASTAEGAPTPAPSTAPTPESTPTPDPARTAEAVRWKAISDGVQRLVRTQRYDDALKAAQAPTFTDPSVGHSRERAVWRLQRLVAFKRTLQADVSASGYPEPAGTLRGVNYPQGFRSANADGVAAATPYGSIAVPWTDLAPKTILQMGMHFAAATADPKAAADRRWLTAVFAVENGFVAEGRAFAAQAAKDRPDYQKDLPRFEE